MGLTLEALFLPHVSLISVLNDVCLLFHIFFFVLIHRWNIP
jgi:hypothetical protein